MKKIKRKELSAMHASPKSGKGKEKQDDINTSTITATRLVWAS